MKTRGIKDLYLPKNISIHVKFFLFCVFFTPVWGLIIKAELNKTFLIPTFLIMFANIEILMFLVKRIFESSANVSLKGISQSEITRNYLARVAIFYIIALVVITSVFALFVILSHITRGYGFPDLVMIFKEVKGVMMIGAVGLSLSIPVFFYKPWQQAMTRESELREQNLIFQNETLKNQINPHFLFNSLNSLNTLVNTQTDIANQFISKLSLIYRYILDNSSKVSVPLKEELAFIEDYFYLHEIRSGGKMFLSIQISEDEYKHKILPVSLQLLIENAIKHNMATLEKPLNISIYMEGQSIVVSNNIQLLATQVVSTKIGLKNLGERIELVTGKEIIIEESTSNFIVKVPLLS